MDNSVFLDEDIPFVESGDYEIDEAGAAAHGSTTTLAHGNIVSLNHPYHNDSMWTTNLPAKRGRRPKSAAVVITTTGQVAEPKRRGRKPKQELLSPKKSNNILSDSTEDLNRKQQQQQRRSTAGTRVNKKAKFDEQQSTTGKLQHDCARSSSTSFPS